MRQRRRGAQSATGARTQSARDPSQIPAPPARCTPLPQVPQVRPLPPRAPSASGTALPQSQAEFLTSRPFSGLGFHRGPLTGSRRPLEGAGLGAEGTHSAAGKGLPCRQRPGGGGWASELVAGRRRSRDEGWVGRRGSRGVSSFPLPPGREPEGRRLAGDSASLCRRPCWLGIAAAPILAEWTAVLVEM